MLLFSENLTFQRIIIIRGLKLTLKYFKEMIQSFIVVLKNLYNSRHIIRQMVITEIKGKFAGSIGGLLWNFLQPVLMLLVYLFVFVYVLKLRIGASGTSESSSIYIMSGLFPWIIMSEGILNGTSSLINNANLIKKTSFPYEILPAKAVIAPLFSFGITLLLLAFFEIIFHGFIGIIFLLPFIVILQLFFTIGLTFLLSTVSIFFRDIIHLIQIVVSFWIFLTPILYPVKMLPETAKKIMYLNPLYPLISIYHSVFLSGNLGQSHMIIIAFFWSTLFFIVGSFFFNKLKYEFADWL